jgi:hypothetical protein
MKKMSENYYNWEKIFSEKTDDFLLDVIKQKTKILFDFEEEKIAVYELIYRGTDINQIKEIYFERLKKMKLIYEKFQKHKTSFYLFSIAFSIIFSLPFILAGIKKYILLYIVISLIFNIIFYFFETKDILKIRKKEEIRRYISIQKMENFINNDINFIKIATKKVIQ